MSTHVLSFDQEAPDEADLEREPAYVYELSSVSKEVH